MFGDESTKGSAALLRYLPSWDDKMTILETAGSIRQKVGRGLTSVCLFVAFTSLPIECQRTPGSNDAGTIRVQSSLVLVDV